MCSAEDDVLSAGIKVLVARGTAEVACLRKDQLLPRAGRNHLQLDQTDPLWPKLNPSANLRKGKTCWAVAVREE